MGRWDWPKAPPCQWDWPKGACDGKVWSLPTATPRGLARLNTMLDTMKAFTYVVWIFWHQERINPESLLGISPKSCFERYWDRDWRPWWPCASSLPQRSWACSLCCFADRWQGPWNKIRSTNQNLVTPNWSYILKTRVLVVQTPQTICNFPQKYCLRTRKLSVSVPES